MTVLLEMRAAGYILGKIFNFLNFWHKVEANPQPHPLFFVQLSLVGNSATF